jgi:hypothetical protein
MHSFAHSLTHSITPFPASYRLLSQPPPLHPEIAILVDDISAATRTILDPQHVAPFDTLLIRDPAIYIASIGAPTRTFLLSDLLLDHHDWSVYKMVVFLNAFVVPSDITAAVSKKLKRGNTTLVFTYAAALFSSADGPRAINTSAVSDFVGIPLRRGVGAANIVTHVPRSESLQAGFPRDYGFYPAPWGRIDPWLAYDASAGE